MSGNPVGRAGILFSSLNPKTGEQSLPNESIVRYSAGPAEMIAYEFSRQHLCSLRSPNLQKTSRPLAGIEQLIARHYTESAYLLDCHDLRKGHENRYFETVAECVVFFVRATEDFFSVPQHPRTFRRPWVYSEYDHNSLPRFIAAPEILRPRPARTP